MIVILHYKLMLITKNVLTNNNHKICMGLFPKYRRERIQVHM